FQHYPKLFAHIRDEHREESPFSIRCELSMMCGSRYSSYDSYRRHIYRCHRSLLDSLDNNDTMSSADISDSIEDLFSDLTFDDTLQCAGDPDSSIYPDEEIDELDRLFSSFDSVSSSSTNQQLNFDKLAQFYTYFLLELREHHLLPQKIVQLISSNICKLFDMIIKLIKTKAPSTTSLLSVTAYENAFAHITSMINSISKNEYQFLKRCKKHFSYEPPVEIILDQPNEHAYYIPLKKSLSYTLQDGQLLHAIIDNINSLSNRVAQDKDLVLSNRQGHFVKTNLYRQTNSNVLLLKLYTDGISITNPIGPHRDSHKLTCFYYLLDDLPEVIRSQVNSIGLHCICYTKQFNNDNSRTILTNVLVEDINKLQNDGITIPCLSSRIYFVFSSVCGDNLASNEVGGFQKSFSSGSFCRHCFITYEQKHIPLTDISFVPRTRLKHDFILNQVILNNGRQIIQGVKGPSWFKDLIGFHPTESLPPDVMHDFSEDDLTLFPVYIILREIISYIYANPIRKSWLPYLDGLCKQFYSLMIEFLPDYVTPKVHFITEYPRSIEMHGLPILNSCIRFESKHLYFKQLAIRSFNFKNPLLTLSKRHQLRDCLLNTLHSSFPSSSITIRSSKSIEYSKLSLPLRRLLIDDIKDTDLICQCASIDYHHINIRTKSIMIHHLIHTEEVPVFCEVHYILNIADKLFVIAETLDTVSFNEKLWAYEIEYTGKLCIINIEHCLKIYPHCLDIYIVEQKNYINVLTRLTEH
ncbi:unnamed protein product, partial [Adineta steineri]